MFRFSIFPLKRLVFTIHIPPNNSSIRSVFKSHWWYKGKLHQTSSDCYSWPTSIRATSSAGLSTAKWWWKLHTKAATATGCKNSHKEHPCIVVQSCTSSKGSSAALEGRRCAAVLFLLTEILENVQKFQKSMFWSPNKANANLQTGRLSHPHAHKQRVLRSWHFFVKKLECHTSHSAQNQTATADRARCSSDHCTGVGPRDVCMSQNSVHRQYARHEMTWNLRYSWTKTLLHQPTQYKNNKN